MFLIVPCSLVILCFGIIFTFCFDAMSTNHNRFVHRKLLADFLFKQLHDTSRSSVRSVLLFLYLKVSFAICLPLQSLLIFMERFITKEEQQSCFSVAFISVCLESPKWSPRKRKCNHFKYHQNCSLYAYNQCFGATS